MHEQLISRCFAESCAVKRAFLESQGAALERAIGLVAGALRQGGKLLLFGNGGSAADAQHLAAEFVNRFRRNRPPLAALALTTDSSVLTSIGNDSAFEEIFARQIRALGATGDVAVAISTSGRSPNVLAAVRAAREQGMKTVGLVGSGGEELAALVDVALSVPSTDTPRIQEAHVLIGHVLCEAVEQELFPVVES